MGSRFLCPRGGISSALPPTVVDKDIRPDVSGVLIVVGAPGGDSEGGPGGGEVGTRVGGSVGVPVGVSVGVPVGGSVGVPVGDSVGPSVCNGPCLGSGLLNMTYLCIPLAPLNLFVLLCYHSSH